MLQVDPREVGRLAELVKNLEDRLEEAEIHSSGGEIEGIKASLEAGRAKLTAVRRSAAWPDRRGHPNDQSPGLTVRALLIGLDSNLTHLELPKGSFNGRFLTGVRKHVNAQAVQPLSLTSRLDLWVDENGIATNRPINTVATRLARTFGSTHNLRGPVVITSTNPEIGTAKSLTSEQVAMIKNRLAGP